MKLPLPIDINSVPYFANHDTEGNLAVPIEQYVLSAGLYVPVSAVNPLPVVVSGSKTKDYFYGTTTITKDYTESPMIGIDITNDGIDSLTYTINGMVITLLAGEADSRDFDTFTSVTVTTAVAFRAWVRG